MRYPYERFLRFLVSRKLDVNRVLSQVGLPPVGGMWLPTCRTTLRASAPYGLVRYLDSADANLLARDGLLAWAEGEGFRELWESQPEFGGLTSRSLDLAIRIFSNRWARVRMGLFLFSKATATEIVEVASQHFDMEIDQEVVDLYRRIFWDGAAISRSDWDALLQSLEDRDERHYLALGFANPTLQGVQAIIGAPYTVEPDDVLRRLMMSAIEQYEFAMKQPIPTAHDALKWGEMAKSAAVALATHQPKKVESSSIPKDFNGLFSVQISKSKHISLADLQGQVGIPEPAKPVEEP